MANVFENEIRQFVLKSYALNSHVTRFPAGLPATLRQKDRAHVMGWSKDQQRSLVVDYVVSWKADGFRTLCGMMQTQNDESGELLPLDFCINRNWETTMLGLPWGKDAFAGTLFDVEYVPSEQNVWKKPMYLIFDVLRLRGNDVRHVSYLMRLSLAYHFLQQQSTQQKRVFFDWKYHTPPLSFCQECQQGPTAQGTGKKLKHATTSFYIFWNKANEQSLWAVKPCFPARHTKWMQKETVPFRTDGLIFTPLPFSVPMFRSPTVYKWKPPQHQTVDFLVQPLPVFPPISPLSDSPFHALHGDVGLFTVERRRLVLYASISRPHGVCWASAEKKQEENTKYLMPNNIYECGWSDQHTMWEMRKARADKTSPNARYVADEVVASLKESLQPWTWWD